MTDNPSYRGDQGQGRPADEYYDERYARPQEEPRAGAPEPRGPYPPEQGGYPPPNEPAYPPRGGYPEQGGYPGGRATPPVAATSSGPRPVRLRRRLRAGLPSAPARLRTRRRQRPTALRPAAATAPRRPVTTTTAAHPAATRNPATAVHPSRARRLPGSGRLRAAQGYGGGYGRPEYGQPELPAATTRAVTAEPAGRDYDYGQPAGGGYARLRPRREYPATGQAVTLQLDDGSGRTYQLREGANVIGRGQDAQFRLPDTGVSRRHLEIRWDGQVALLSDLNSTNGTTVNNAPVQEWQLADGDVIRLGHSEIIVRVH